MTVTVQCYLCSSQRGALRDLGGIRIFLCGDCFRYCVKMSKARVTA